MLYLLKTIVASLKNAKRTGRRASAPTSRRACLAIETLEDRQLMTTGIATLPPLPIAPALLLTSQKTPTVILDTTAQKAVAPMVAAASAQLAPASVTSRTVLSVVTIRNQNNFTINYAIQWPGQAWQNFSVAPNGWRMHWFSKAGLRPLIDFDKSFAAGVQDQRYVLSSKPFVSGGKEAWKPTIASDGMIFDFRMTGQSTGLTLVRQNALDTTRNASVRAKIDAAFPSLHGNFEVLGPATGGSAVPGSYNCIAWSMGLVNQWVWTGAKTDANGDDLSTLQDLFNQYLKRGFHMLTSLDYSYQPGVEKVVVYGHYDSHHAFRPTHGALQMSDGTWTSKCGGLGLIRHLTPDVFGDWNSDYGRPVAVFVRNA